MRLLFRIFLYICSCFLIVAMHITVVYLLPRPVSLTNIIFVMLISMLMIWESGMVILFSFFLHMILEIYVTTTPYGVILFAGAFACYLTYTLHKYVFTNRTWYAGMVLTAVAILLMRIIYLGLLITIKILTGLPPIVSWSRLLLDFTWELVLSSLIAGAVLGLASLVLPELKGTKVIDKFGIGFKKV